MMCDPEEICEQLESHQRHDKISALTKLVSISTNKKSTTAEVAKVFEDCYLHLLRSYGDRYECVRQQAVIAVTTFITRLPPNDFYMANILAVLAERMGQVETIETSEEVRLLCTEQLHSLIIKQVAIGGMHAVQECYENIMRIVQKTLGDNFPAVMLESSRCVVLLARWAKTHHFQKYAGQLALPLFAMLRHKHSSVRICAVTALGRLALHIDAKGDALSRLIMEVTPLLMDPMPLVRRECGDMGVLLLLELGERYSYFERIIPLVLCCLKDATPDVVDYIRPRWEQCGRQFYEENEVELNKQDMGDPQPKNYPLDVQRPTIGCRGLVQRSLRLLKLITREAGDWKQDIRIHSLRLLYQFVLHAEAAMTAKFFEIYADVARACVDVSEVAQEALKVSDLMGRLFSYVDWSEHGFDGLMRNAKEGYLKCFYHMFTAAAGVQMNDVGRVGQILTKSAFSQTFKSGTQLYVLKMVDTLLDKAAYLGHDKHQWVEEEQHLIEQLNRNMYISTIKVMALIGGADRDAMLKQGEAILLRIAQRQNLTLAALHEAHFAFALDFVQNIDAYLDEFSEPIQLFDGLLRLCLFRAPYMAALQLKFCTVFKHCGPDARLKIFTAISVAMLKWNESVARPLDESTELLRKFLEAVVEPHLVWCSGGNAEALRAMAIATVCAMSQGAGAEAQQLLPKLAKYMPNLLEDRSVTTRHYAVKSLLNFGPLAMDELKPIAYATLQRMDDPSGDIRQLAATVIPKLCPQCLCENCEEIDYGIGLEHDREIWDTFIKKAVEMLFLHYEGPEIRLKAAIEETLKELADKYPAICKESYERALAMSYNTDRLSELHLATDRTKHSSSA